MRNPEFCGSSQAKSTGLTNYHALTLVNLGIFQIGGAMVTSNLRSVLARSP
jgi:hypothetical protein